MLLSRPRRGEERAEEEEEDGDEGEKKGENEPRIRREGLRF